jgi:predicted small lipoprotein YifL
MKYLVTILFVLSLLVGCGEAAAQSGPLSWPNTAKRTAAKETVTLKSGPGTLHYVTVGVVGTTSSVIFYDNTEASGTVLANLTTTVLTTFTLGVAFSTGLTYVTSGGAAADITISYK